MVSWLAWFFAGAFLANAVPHFVMGSTGRRFQSPFASPPGRGESSPLVNVLWGFTNLVFFHFLIHVGEFAWGHNAATAVFGLGFLGMGVFLAHHFGAIHSPPTR